MLLNIIFSYNRAMQLDYLLKSILKNFKFNNYNVLIIFHTTGEHRQGYQLLQEEYKEYPVIKFLERKQGFDVGIIKALNSKDNLRFFLRHHFKQKNRDNFKGLLEELLKNTESEFVMFNTDDGVFIKNFILDETIMNLIRNNPKTLNYRTYVGDNLEGFPNYVKPWGDHYLWDYYYDKNTTHWSFPFAVDGTVYHTKGILSILENVAYHNPVTLEDRAVSYVIKNNLMSIGLSPKHSYMVCTKLNRVSIDSSNPTIHIETGYLNQKFIDGYRLILELPTPIDNANLVPKRVILLKDKSEEIIYELDERGKMVQDNLGIEGAKTQIE